LLGFEPRGFLTQDAAGAVRCGCFRVDLNPDAPDIVLPGTKRDFIEKARIFCRQRDFIPVFVKGEDFGWEYCGKYRVEAVTSNTIEISIHAKRGTWREETIAMVLFLEKEQ
jgi:hypothetical protein